ncbi:MAG TPA: hypothetical protein PKA28_15695 [Methylomusa anaerophila]|uniref:Uncharacterized protein n=1 Tax=Methylomusa anaerophila TaxID=1930071 RepID=A0A348AHC3_9FIRM|nr:hypothetical protein [Methylomusa anaerophila]BBB90471.1 hypothetical protein MAMMFC1_01122 [Methylomusa anaerophila]HML89887.1 hypothetical protein [Methylomusa anaerophila]
MYIIATFEHSAYLELAISDLEIRGVANPQILAVPLAQQRPQMNILDTIHRADGVSVLDGTCIAASLATTLGVVYGYVLPGGPLLWGLAGMIIGGSLALVIDYFLTRRDRPTKGPPRSAEVVLIVKCDPGQAQQVEDILHSHLALGLARVEEEQGFQ